jgi:hypothetical protein
MRIGTAGSINTDFILFFSEITEKKGGRMPFRPHQTQQNKHYKPILLSL